MDTLYWNKLNPTVEFNSTIKQFYNQYLWRMVIDAPGGKLLYSKNPNLEEALEHRKNVKKLYNPGSWYRRSTNVEQINLNLLSAVRAVKSDFIGQCKMRIEEPNIQFYAQDELTLKKVAEQLPVTTCIKTVTGPELSTIPLLESGAIISRVPVTYTYKFIIRDGRYPAQVKQQLLNYLDGLGEDVKLSKTCRDMLGRPYPSIWSVYFYAQDDSIATFISLIGPNLISNIHRMVSLDR